MLVLTVEVTGNFFSFSSAVLEIPAKQDRKRKHKHDKIQNGKKKIETNDRELSSADKHLLERWSNMQKSTKPFIHPIRNHIGELLQLNKDSVINQNHEKNHETVKGDLTFLFSIFSLFIFNFINYLKFTIIC